MVILYSGSHLLDIADSHPFPGPEELERNLILIPAAGWRNGDSLNNAGENGNYWSSSLNSDKSYNAYNCWFNSSNVNPSNWNNRYNGQSVRPVSSSSQHRLYVPSDV